MDNIIQKIEKRIKYKDWLIIRFLVVINIEIWNKRW